MSDLRKWCAVGVPEPVGRHRASVIESNDEHTGIATLAASLPNVYAGTKSLALIAQQLNKDDVATFLRNKLPTKASARSGDMGEILATAYLREEAGYVVGPSRLIQRDHQEWAMRGDDVLGARVDADGKPHIVKAEAKSRVELGKGTVVEARKGLARNNELPSPHSLTQFAARLIDASDDDAGRVVLALQLLQGVHPERVRHLMFLFTSSDPSKHVDADLRAYSGAVPQLTITLRVRHHQEFIRTVYERATSGGS